MLEKRIFTLHERQRALLEMQRLNPVPAVPEIELQDPILWASAPQAQLVPLTAEHQCSNGFFGCYCDESGN